ncbi:hypothetical protein IB279_29230 [Ensifer sp. ENS06]|uniref:hypothetical protein n=1 Tax=Ensifer sp. ENS06 TaxID=2769276 RepID=UPI00177B9BC5|nr:hypothetical protein [Ensifer sp. ENS06]MBD9627038.1 hypothetical protein [Ensifer sp. ENS06]
MKPQQRKFVVEFKSGRRRSTINPSSIWGDTDLKALVREAETEAPHLFEPADRTSEDWSEQSAELSSTDGTSIATSIAEPGALAEELRANQNAADSAFISPSQEDSPKTTSPGAPQRPRRARSVRRSVSETITAATEVPSDDLAALEEENRRLKDLLARRLHHENNRLRRMLERFKTDEALIVTEKTEHF